MSGRRKGLEAERAALRALRAEGLRVLRVARDRNDPEGDVDAVILLGIGRCVEVQIRSWADAWKRWRGWANKTVRAGRVLMVREPRSPWYVVRRDVRLAGGLRVSSLQTFAQETR